MSTRLARTLLAHYIALMIDQATRRDQIALNRLSFLGLLLCLMYVVIDLIWSFHERIGLDNRERIVPVVGLYFVASILALLCIRTCLSIQGHRQRLCRRIVGFAICFRIIQLCVHPILEIDLYRYMWDGIVINNGMSPYEFSPNQVLSEDLSIDDPTHQKIVELASSTESIRWIVSTIHYPDFTSIYPPVSQAVFAVAMMLVPDSASVEIHLLTMKLVIVLFDLLTIWLVFGLLKKAQMHVGWLVAYAWNPLVIKESANSGHLDSIAVCFATSAIFILLSSKGHSVDQKRGGRESACAVLLALGTGAKLYPIVLLPLIFVRIGKSSWNRALRFAMLYAATSVLVMAPMFLQMSEYGAHRKQKTKSGDSVQEGLASFLTHWRMNDVTFSFFFENAKPDSGKVINHPWYVFTPNSLREGWSRIVKANGLSQNPPFLAARIVTTTIYLLIYFWLLKKSQPHTLDNREFLNLTFVTLVAFFFLQPTQNPWYWLWLMPLVCFASNRGWLLVATFLFCYYVRFWFKYSDVRWSIGEFQYQSEGIYDHCIAWIQHLAIAASVVGYRIWERRIVSQ